jgi:DNA-binding PadR family transcriptional regulator
MAPTNLGELEQLVLLAIARLGDDAYGVTIRREIATRAKRDLAFGSVYTTLARLEEKGLVASHLGDATPERGGRAKKHFVISVAGRRALQRSLRAIRTMARGINASWETP